MSNTLLHAKAEAPCLALRPREAARALGVSERTLWTWTQQGSVPFVRRGKTVMYPVAALTRWLDEQANVTAMPATANATEGGNHDPR